MSTFSMHYLNHEFDLLGSGWVKVKHGIHCQGLRGHRYETGQPIGPDKEGNWLDGRINPSNLGESQCVWRLVGDKYTPIDWQLDFKSGYRWKESVWHKDILCGHKHGADIKVPRELARCQHLPMLAMAYALASRDVDGFEKPEKYLSEFRNQTLDFMATNPPRYGANWACTMDVGIRAANWLLSYDIFKAQGARFDPPFEKKFAQSIYEHGLHIINNLEFLEELTSNHYLSDIAGLLFTAAYLPHSDETEGWLQFAVRELIKEMKKQVYSDGTDFEASTCYHRLVLELFFYSTLLIVKKDVDFNGKNYTAICKEIFGCEYTEKLYRMFDAVCYLLKPNGKMPRIGDNDSGQFFKLYPRDVLDMRYLQALGAVFFKESKWKISEFFKDEEALAEIEIIYGKDGKKIWESLPEYPTNSITAKNLNASGWYLMRDKRDYLLITCGSNGQNYYGGHSHNDKLSFELTIDGQDIIVDPGTYLYTPDPNARDLFRSTAYHNTVVIDQNEQNRFLDWNLFLLNNDSKARCLKWESKETYDLFVGEHYGYGRLKEPVIHNREILFDKIKRMVKIKDHFSGKGRHLFEWYFHFAPDIVVQFLNNANIILRSKSGTKVALFSDMIDEKFNVAVLNGWVSPAYGSKIKAKTIRYRTERAVDFEVVFELT